MENPSNIVPDQLIVLEGDAGLVPKAEPADAGKVLGVLNASGDVGWVVDQSGTFIQQQANWSETDPSKVTYIENKPDLSVYATTSSMNTALAGKQDTISDLADIRSGASAGATAVQPAALEDYATVSAMNTALAGKQNTISDLDTIRAGAAAGATAAQPSDLPSSDELLPSASSGDAGKILSVDASGNPEWITPSGGTTYSAGDGIDIDANNVISADVDGTTIGIDSTTKKIKSLQTIPTKTSDLQNDSNFVVASSLATVATSGSYADLSNKPTIPTKTSDLQNDSNFVVASSLATVATSGSYADLSNKPSIPAAQVNADWDASTGVSAILNKPSLAAVATTGDYSDLTGTPTIPTVDQTYNSASTNAQSGTAVAQAIASIPSSSYTAGDGIDITSNEISVDYDSTLTGVHPFESVTATTIQSTGTGYNGNAACMVIPSDVKDWLNNGSGTITIHIPGNAYKRPGTTSYVARLLIGHQTSVRSSWWVITSPKVALSTTYDSVSDTTFVQEQDVTVNIPVSSWTSQPSSCDYITVEWLGADANYPNADSYSYFVDNSVGAQFVFNKPDATRTQLSVSKPLPASTSADEDKVLTVNSSGTPVWAASSVPSSKPLVAGSNITITDGANDVTIAATDTTYTAGNMMSLTNGAFGVSTTAGITDIQIVNALPASPVATVLYLIQET